MGHAIDIDHNLPHPLGFRAQLFKHERAQNPQIPAQGCNQDQAIVIVLQNGSKVYNSALHLVKLLNPPVLWLLSLHLITMCI